MTNESNNDESKEVALFRSLSNAAHGNTNDNSADESCTHTICSCIKLLVGLDGKTNVSNRVSKAGEEEVAAVARNSCAALTNRIDNSGEDDSEEASRPSVPTQNNIMSVGNAKEESEYKMAAVRLSLAGFTIMRHRRDNSHLHQLAVKKLHGAIETRDLENFRIALCSKGTASNAFFRDQTPLMLVCGMSSESLPLISEDEIVELVQDLLRAGADPSLASPWEFGQVGPLQLATHNGRLRVVKALISSGADVNTLDAAGRSALFDACTFGVDDGDCEISGNCRCSPQHSGRRKMLSFTCHSRSRR